MLQSKWKNRIRFLKKRQKLKGIDLWIFKKSQNKKMRDLIFFKNLKVNGKMGCVFLQNGKRQNAFKWQKIGIFRIFLIKN